MLGIRAEKITGLRTQDHPPALFSAFFKEAAASSNESIA
jgi:hypothetical protein